jgi:hypothetical protein
MAPVSNILGTYSPESVVITIGNDKFSHVLSGYADGTFISITLQTLVLYVLLRIAM